MIILGIDPGTAILGWGFIEYKNKKSVLIGYGAITTDSKEEMSNRLKTIFNELSDLITLYKPNHCVIEELFFNTNIKTGIAVGQARGVAMLASSLKGIPIYEYTPLQVKMAVTGYGRAYKGQMQQMVKLILGMDVIPKPDDAADALAIALAHTQYSKNL